MDSYNWIYAFTSITGTSHEKLNLPCQDCCECQVIKLSEGSEILVAVVSDGAGSAKYAEDASRLICSLVIREILAFFENGNGLERINREFINDLIKHIREEILLRADNTNSKLRDYASTVLTAIIGESEAVFFQLGDGAIVVSDSEEINNYGYVFWPQRGEYENTTFFITDDTAFEKFEFENVKRRIERFAIFSDGIQRLALNYQHKKVHMPFFQMLFKYLESSKENSSEDIVVPIKKLLNSQLVNERTDDDKTIFLALRRV